MTKQQKDTQNVAFEVLKSFKNNGGYIKGYGDKLHRVMSATHSPMMNIKNDVVECLKFNKIIEMDGLIHVPTAAVEDFIFSDQLLIEGAAPDKNKKKHYVHKF